MAEFKLKKGPKIYHIREFSSVLELARRGLVDPRDPIFVPSVGRWVYARAIQELRPLLKESEGDTDEAVELPAEFVEPLASDVGGLTVEVDLADIGIGLSGEHHVQPKKASVPELRRPARTIEAELVPRPATGRTEAATPGAHRGQPPSSLRPGTLRSDPGSLTGTGAPRGGHGNTQTASNPSQPVPSPGQASGASHPSHGGRGAGLGTQPRGTPPGNGRALDSSGEFAMDPSRTGASARPPRATARTTGSTPPIDLGWARRSHDTDIAQEFGRQEEEPSPPPAPNRSHKPGLETGAHAPLAFDAWMAQHGQSSSITSTGETPRLSMTSASGSHLQKRAYSIWRLGAILSVLAVLGGVYYWYVNSTANMVFDPVELDQLPGKGTSTEIGTNQEVRGVDPAQPDRKVLASDTALRQLIRPQQSPMRTFDQSQDELFGELLNLKVPVVDVSLEPLEGSRFRSVRTTPSKATVRLKQEGRGRYNLDQQTALVGLVIGKYTKRHARDQNKLYLQELTIQIETPGEEPIRRVLDATKATAYFNRKMNIREFLLVVQAGTQL